MSAETSLPALSLRVAPAKAPPTDPRESEVVAAADRLTHTARKLTAECSLGRGPNGPTNGPPTSGPDAPQ